MDDDFKKVSFSKTETEVQSETNTSFQPVIENIPTNTMSKKMNSKVIIPVGAFVIILLGIGTGFSLSKAMPNKAEKSTSASMQLPTGEDAVVEVNKIYGSENEEAFPDKVIGVLEKGGLDGEGSHRLLREGGPKQTTYLTSSVLVLDPFVGSKVEVWGETYAAQQAAWLLDVGGVKVLELNAPKPFQEEPTLGAQDQEDVEK